MSATRIDWSQVWYPGPPRAFTADEMARAGGNGPSPTLLVVVAANVLAVAALVSQLVPQRQLAGVVLAFVFLILLGGASARWLWWRPWRRPLMQVSVALVVVMLLVAMSLRALLPAREDRSGLALVLAGGGGLLPILLWFLVAWRALQIEARLRELAEREKAIEMARRLATAQL